MLSRQASRPKGQGVQYSPEQSAAIAFFVLLKDLGFLRRVKLMRLDVWDFMDRWSE